MKKSRALPCQNATPPGAKVGAGSRRSAATVTGGLLMADEASSHMDGKFDDA